MTPAETYAQKRLEAIELIRNYAPARLQDSLIELLRPAIALLATRTDDSEIPIGASKFGGAPDVPPDFLWPEWNGKPLGFLAQINLEEVAPFDLEELLPKSGLLSFFHWNDEVFYFKEVSHRATEPLGIEPDFEITFNVRLQPTVFASFPNISCVEWNDELGVEPLKNQWGDWLYTLEKNRTEKPIYRLLSYPESAQADVRLDSGGEHWRDWMMLFQFDEDEEAQSFWGDAFDYWTVRRADLERARFDRCLFHEQCT